MKSNETAPDVQPTGDTDKRDLTADKPSAARERPLEIGGPKGLEPTRYGDWERKGRCIDF